MLDRFGQIEPVIFIAPDGYWYNGKAIEVADKVAAVAAKLPCPQGSVRRLSRHLGRCGATIDKCVRDWKRPAPFAVKPVDLRAAAVRRIRSTSCIRRARPASRNASSIAPAARCSSI